MISKLTSDMQQYSDNRTRYVAGFLFSHTRDTVVLIEKTKPAWQKGKFNGVGGKIEVDETPLEAMRREFHEETGVAHSEWRMFCTLRGLQFEVNFFVGFGDTSKVRTVETERVVAVPMCIIDRTPVIPNLRWLIPMALDKDALRAAIFESCSFSPPTPVSPEQ